MTSTTTPPAPPAKESPFDVVERVGPIAVFRSGPKPRGPADRHGAVDVDGERVSVFLQTGPSWPTPAVADRGKALLAVRDRSVARALLYGSARNHTHFAIERVGGVALPALVRRVRKRSGALPPVTCARIARDYCRAQTIVDVATPPERARAGRTLSSMAATVADTVVAWDGRVVVAPRLFGTPADSPTWLERASLAQIVGALLFALLAPDLGDDVDAQLVHHLAGPPALDQLGSPELTALIALLAPPTAPRRRRGAAPQPANIPLPELADRLDAIVRALGGDSEEFAAGLMAEIFGDRKRADLAWREEMTAVPLG